MSCTVHTDNAPSPNKMLMNTTSVPTTGTDRSTASVSTPQEQQCRFRRGVVCPALMS